MPPDQLKIYEIFYIMTGVLLLANLLALRRKRLQKEVPWLVAYLAVMVMDMAVCAYQAAFSSTYTFFYTAWAFQALVVFFGWMVMVECMRNALVPYPLVRRWSRNLMIGAGVVLVGFAIWTLPYAINSQLASQSDYAYMKATSTLMRSIRLVQVGVIVVFLGFTSVLALNWRHYQIGILLGYAFYLVADFAYFTLSAYSGAAVAFRGMIVSSSVYLLVLILWLGYILKQEPSHDAGIPPASAGDLRAWERALHNVNRG